jgi:hypothetical protein
MPQRMTPSQWRSKLRQAEQRRRQAINKINAAVRRYNQGVKRAVDDYNREVRAHNARVRTNRQRLRTALATLGSRQTTGPYVSYRVSVETLQQAFFRIERQREAGAWGATHQPLLDLTEGETANSVEVLTALTADAGVSVEEVPGLRDTLLTTELAGISPDLDQRWRGALFALDSRNPDAARHFCASSREIITQVLHREAPDDQVLASVPKALIAPDGKPTRRARVHYFLRRKGWNELELEDFVENDLENVVTLFDVLNEGAHGAAGAFSLGQLAAIKRRVEDAVRFLHSIIR